MEEEVVTLSDHPYIVFDVAIHRQGTILDRRSRCPARRWALKRMNRDMLVAAAIVADWPGEEEERVLSDPEAPCSVAL